MKKTAFILGVMFLLTGMPRAMAQLGTTPTVTCIPLQQVSAQQTQLECRMRTPETPYFLVAEVEFPFAITRLIKVSSSFSATLGTSYPAQLVENTVMVASVDWGSQSSGARLQPIPFDTLSFLVETNQSLGTVKRAFEQEKTTVSLLTPNPADPLDPFFQSFEPDHYLLFDGSLILESFTQYVSPGVLQFLRLGLACYEKSPQACLTNIIQNL
ncbi:MAG: hypothetical protein AB7J40_01640 [Candidatus Altimarinota bacterium]